MNTLSTIGSLKRIEIDPDRIKESEILGIVCIVTCPVCKETFTLVKGDKAEVRCECGYKWKLWMKAIGDRDE